MNIQQIQPEDKEMAKRLALGQLAWLRQPSDCYKSNHEGMLEQMQKGSLSLEDLGTNQEEIDSLVRQGKKALAVYLLVHLGHGDKDYTYHIEKVRRLAVESSYSLADFGTNEAQLAEFTKSGAKVAARYWLQKFKEGYSLASSRIFGELAVAGLSLFGLNVSPNMRKILEGKSIRKQPAEKMDSDRPNVTVREITAADAKRLQWKSSHPGLKFGDSSLELMAESINRQAAELPRTRFFKLSWVGNKVPRGAIVLEDTIAWTQNGQVVTEKREFIGTYQRLVEFGGLFNNQHVIIISLFPNQE